MHSTRFQRLHRRFGAALMPSRIAFLAVLLYLISLIPIFLFSSYCHPLADDFTYGLLVHRAVVSGGGIPEILSAAAETVRDYYFTWQGTFSAIFLFALQPGAFSESAYFLTPFIIIGCLSLSTFVLMHFVYCRLLGGKSSQAVILSALTLLLSVQMVTNQAQAFYWFNGASYYAVFYSFSLLFFAGIGTLLLDAGKKVVQETRRWDDNKESSHAMRSKEDAQDYRYFPEPDLVPIVISDEWIAQIKARQPELRTEKLERYKKEFGLPDYDAEIITGHKKFADLFEATTEICKKPKKVSNWIMGEIIRLLKENEMDPEDIKFSPVNLAKVIELADSGAINSTVAKEVFEEVFKNDIDPDKYVEEKGLKTVNDAGELRTVVEQVIKDNPQSVEDYRNGKEKAIGFLVGQTMKAMKGKANPGMVNQILKELL